MGAGFASTDRFLAELRGNKLRPGYVLIGDEIFLYERCRRAVLEAFVPADLRDFCLSDLDLAETSIFEALDRAQTPSLMAPFQVLFIRNLKQLYTRGAKKEEFAAIDGYFRSPNPQVLLIFVADHLRIPSDPRRMDMSDKDRYERIRETLGDHCGIIELARVDEADAFRWLLAEAEKQQIRLEQDAARELVDALGADMMLIAGEFEKLALYAGQKKLITLGDVET
ncbi:MAG TPA: DNA polymerase III subunit delta, partial [Alloacidobacterium sp.]|nr:DNA polymerase III subunit delta [Alloacidobacterium sp.]